MLPEDWFADWGAAVVRDLARLFHVPRPLWLALVALSLLRFGVGLIWADGASKIASRASGGGRLRALRANAVETVRLLVIVLAFTLGGNSAPDVFGWAVVASWGAAVWFTVRYVWKTASPAESDLRAAFSAVQNEVARRNLDSMRPVRLAGDALDARDASEPPAFPAVEDATGRADARPPGPVAVPFPFPFPAPTLDATSPTANPGGNGPVGR